LVGESGAGKSMIGKAVLGVLPRAAEVIEGCIRLDGEDLLRMPPGQRRRIVGAKTALIPQDPLTALNPSQRIGPQITDRLVDILRWPKQRARRRAVEALKEVHIPEPERVLRLYPHELSGGMRQRILIASAFAAEPKLIVADEPTTALDVTVQRQILLLIAELQERHGTALLFVTHDLGVVAKTCDTVSVLYAGKVVERADVESFSRSPGILTARRSWRPRLGTTTLPHSCAQSRPRLSKPCGPKSRKTTPSGLDEASCMAEALLRVVDLVVDVPDMGRKPLFGAAPRLTILNRVSFDLPRGGVLGIVGGSGSGKTTLGRALVRLMEPSGGSIHFDGSDIAHLSDAEMRPLRRRLQMIFQDPMSS
jgi:peptide/nickel transport system ATP-binding protein